MHAYCVMIYTHSCDDIQRGALINGMSIGVLKPKYEVGGSRQGAIPYGD